jgi:hypothetical protein
MRNGNEADPSSPLRPLSRASLGGVPRRLAGSRRVRKRPRRPPAASRSGSQPWSGRFGPHRNRSRAGAPSDPRPGRGRSFERLSQPQMPPGVAAAGRTSQFHRICSRVKHLPRACPKWGKQRSRALRCCRKTRVEAGTLLRPLTPEEKSETGEPQSRTRTRPPSLSLSYGSPRRRPGLHWQSRPQALSLRAWPPPSPAGTAALHSRHAQRHARDAHFWHPPAYMARSSLRRRSTVPLRMGRAGFRPPW